MQNHECRQVAWDPDSSSQIDEAKLIYRDARQKLLKIVDEQDQPLEFFLPRSGFFKIAGKELADGQVKMHILDETGDRTLVWNSKDDVEVEEAAKVFADYLARGWKAYAVKNDGEKQRRIRKFNPELQEVEFDEGPVMKFKQFLGAMKKVQMLPKTYPG